MRTPRLELEPLREAHMPELLELVAEGIHDPATMPFVVPFTDTPSPRRERESVAFWLGCWAGISSDGWRLPFVAVLDGTCVGLQDVAAVAFAERRTVETGSWLGRGHQGRGLGTEMRAAVLHLAFGHLGALRAESSAFEDNVASIGVTRALGYRSDGERMVDRRGVPARQLCFVMDRVDWERSAAARLSVEVRGVDDEVLDQLGVAAARQRNLDSPPPPE